MFTYVIHQHQEEEDSRNVAVLWLGRQYLESTETKGKKKRHSDPVTGPVWPRGWVEV